MKAAKKLIEEHRVSLEKYSNIDALYVGEFNKDEFYSKIGQPHSWYPYEEKYGDK